MSIASTRQTSAPSEAHPVSHGQRALFLLHRMAPESPAYTIAAAGRVRPPAGETERELLRRAFATLIERHGALRTVFDSAGREPVQRIEEPGAAVGRSLDSVDGSGWEADEVPERLAELAFRPFDLEEGPLFRVSLVRRGPEETFVVLSMHHAVGDLWSLALLMRELGAAYGAHASERDPAEVLEPPPRPFVEWVRERRELLEGAEGECLRRFWHDRLGGGVPPLELPTDRPRPPVQSFDGGVVSRSLGPGLRRTLGRTARDRGSNLFAALVAGFQAVLGRWAAQEEFAVGTPTSGRRGAGSEVGRMVGYLVNPVPLRVRLSGDPTFEELLRRVDDETAGALEHQAYPFPLLAEHLEGDRDPSRPPVFQVMLTLQKSPVPGLRHLGAFALGREGAPLELGPLAMDSVPLPQRGAQFDLNLFVTQEDRGLVASLEYDGALFEPATARRLLGHLATLLEAAAGSPERRLSELPILTAEEERQVLDTWPPGEGGELPAVGRGGTLLHGLVAEQAARTPGAEALLAGEHRWTYGELDRAASAVARGLRERGIGPERTVGVFLRRTPELVAAVLGILKAGAAYVPLDPEYPEERLEVVLEDSRIQAVLTEAALAGRLPEGAARPVLVADLLEAGPERLAAGQAGGTLASDPGAGPEPDPENLAYVIYTSGSTGRPKGVAISHRSAAALVAWAGEAFDRRELSGVLASTSVCFDLSVFELFVPLAHGGRVVLADDALALPRLPGAGEVTLVNTVPSAIAELCQGEGLPPSVATVNLAGEPLRRSLVDDVYRAGAGRVLNLYGPSEDTTYSTVAHCPPGVAEEPTIGRAVRGGRAHVFDPSLRPVPQGVPGELLLGGAGLARGYLGRPALTAERWVPDPFAGRLGVPGGRLYRTGDLARWLPGGELEFQGRVDHQVKVRGFRIELGEVETALAAHSAVAEVVVMARGEGAARRLVAYLVADGGDGAQGLPPVGELRAFAGRRVPGYMVPDAFVELPELPLTPNGKVDRRALPEPGSERPELDREFVPPETAVEQILAELWADALGVERIGIHDSFFELGGHSLAANQVLLRVRETFGVDLPIHRLFEEPTIAGLCRAIADELVARADEATVAEILGSAE